MKARDGSRKDAAARPGRLARLLAAALAAASLAHPSARAEETRYKSVYGGRDSYLVVTAPLEGEAPGPRAPGIYVIGEKPGQFVPIALGTPLHTGTVTGILRESSLAESSSQVEAVSVIDGRIVLIKRDPRQGKGTALAIGGAPAGSPKMPSLQVTDPLTGRAVELPEIHELADVEIASVIRSHLVGELLIVSVRAKASPFPLEKNETPGVTFALWLPFPKNKPDREAFRIPAAPVVVDYRFIPNAAAAQVFNGTTSNQVSVISAPVLQAELKKIRARGLPVLASLEAGIDERLKAIDRAARDRAARGSAAESKDFAGASAATLPTVDPFTHRIRLIQPIQTLLNLPADNDQDAREVEAEAEPAAKRAPVAQLAETGGQQSRSSQYLIQRIDPVAGTNDVLIQNRTVPGLVNTAGSRYHIYPIRGAYRQGLVLIDRNLYYVSLTGSGSAVELKAAAEPEKPGAQSIKRISAYVTHGPEHDYLFVSTYRSSAKAATTDVYEIRNSGSMPLLLRQGPVIKKAYPRRELAMRVIKTPSGAVAFDDQTPSRRSEELFEKARNRKVPVLSIDALLKGQRRAFLFLEPADSTRLLGNETHSGWSVYHLSFASRPGQERTPDGVYFFGPGAPDVIPGLETPELTSHGELLRMGKDGANAVLAFETLVYPLPQKSLGSEKSAMRANLIVYAVDPGRNGGRNGFELHVVGVPAPDNPVQFPPFRMVKKIDLPFRRLNGVVLKRGRGDKYKEIDVIAGFDKLPGAPQAPRGSDKLGPAGGVMYFSSEVRTSAFYRDDKNRMATTMTFEDAHKGLLAREAVDVMDLVRRVREGNDGSIFWSLTPDLAPDDIENRVIQLGSGREMTPLRQSGGKVKFLTEDEILERDKNERMGGGAALESMRFLYQLSSWEVGTEWEFERRFGQKYRPEAPKESQDEDASDDDDDDAEARRKSRTRREEKTESLVGLQSLLDELADRTKPPRRVVLLVSPEQKAAAKELVFRSLYPRPRPVWSFRNPQLTPMFFDPAKAEQSDFATAFQRIRRRGGEERFMVIADAADLAKVERPVPGEDEDLIYAYKKPKGKGAAGAPGAADEGHPEADPAAAGDGVAGSEMPDIPHALYVLAAEGENLQPAEFKRRMSTKAKAPIASQVVIATADEWRKLREENPVERRSGLFKDAYEINSDYLTGPWTLAPPTSAKATKQVKEHYAKPFNPIEHQIFPSLEKLLEELANPSHPNEQVVLVVPEQVKALVWRLVYSRWSSRGAPEGLWTYRNPKLSLNVLDNDSKQVDQQGVFEAYAPILEQAEGRRSLVMADLVDVQRVGRPNPSRDRSEGGFRIRDRADSQSTVFDEEEAKAQSHLPHLLYLMANEGRRVQPEQFAAQDPEKRELVASTLLIGSPQEWDRVQRDAAFEERFGLKERFKVVELDVPTSAVRKELLAAVLKRFGERGVHYRAELEIRDKTIADLAQAKLDAALGYLVNRTETLAVRVGEEATSAFIRVLTEFQRVLIEDPEVRRTRVIDLPFLERLLARVFPLPYDPNILPKDDFLVRISNVRQAAQAMQEHGYEGPASLRETLLSTILSQTRENPGKKMPASQILFGETSSGKTFWWETLVGMLGLKMYDFNQPNDESVQAFRLDVARIRKNDDPDPSRITVQEAIAHLNNFLAMPYGSRGVILIDDLHKGDEETVSSLLQFIQSLLDADKGLHLATRLNNKESRLIPVRNLSLSITVNPTGDQQKLKQYMREDKSATEQERIQDMLVATLSSKAFPLERSFFARFGNIINFGNFPVLAKSATLARDLRKNAENGFTLMGRLTMASPKVIEQIVQRFEKANAREFLADAISNLLATGAATDAPRGSIQLIVPASERGNAFLPGGGRFGPHPILPLGGAPGSDRANDPNLTIAEYVSEEATVISVNSIPGKIQFMDLILDSFRTTVTEFMIRGVQSDELGNAANPVQEQRVADFLTAVTTHVTEKPRIPIENLRIDPREVGAVNAAQIREFEAASRRKPGQLPFFPFQFFDEFPTPGWVESILGDGDLQEQRSRVQILTETSEKLERDLERALSTLLRVEDCRKDTDPAAWLANLKSSERLRPALTQVASSILQRFNEFEKLYYQRGLAETLESERYAKAQFYDLVRLFLYGLDRAITRLPWGKTARLLISGFEAAGTDYQAATHPGLLDYAFKSPFSLLKPPSHEHLIQIAGSNPAFAKRSREEIERFKERFGRDCTRFFRQP